MYESQSPHHQPLQFLLRLRHKKQVDENSKDKREYHTFGNPDTLTRAKDNKVINTKDVDEGEFSKVKTMPPLKPIVTGPKDDQYYVND